MVGPSYPRTCETSAASEREWRIERNFLVWPHFGGGGRER